MEAQNLLNNSTKWKPLFLKESSQNGSPKTVQKKWFPKWKPKIFLNNSGTKMEAIFFLKERSQNGRPKSFKQ